MAKGERTYYCRRDICTSCGRITRFSPYSDLCNSCGGTTKVGIVKGTERGVHRFLGLCHTWVMDLGSEVFHRWEEEKEAKAS